MKKFLTIKRNLEYKGILEVRDYFFDEQVKNIVEEIIGYVLDTGELIEEYEKSKTISAEAFMINLPELTLHPDMVFMDQDFIDWYALEILADRL